MDDPAAIRAEIADVRREIDETMAELHRRLDVRSRTRAAAQRARPALRRALLEARTASPGAPSARGDLLDRAHRVSVALRGEPLAAVAVAVAVGLVYAVLTTPGRR